jgi:hypothetical protein
MRNSNKIGSFVGLLNGKIRGLNYFFSLRERDYMILPPPSAAAAAGWHACRHAPFSCTNGLHILHAEVGLILAADRPPFITGTGIFTVHTDRD